MVAVLGAVVVAIGIPGAEAHIAQGLVETLSSGFAHGEQGLREFCSASRSVGNHSEKFMQFYTEEFWVCLNFSERWFQWILTSFS